MASTDKANRPAKGVSTKFIVKYLSKYCAISVEDLTSPNPERTMDIFWNILCHIHGEDKLLESMRGKEAKRLLLSLPIRALLDRLPSAVKLNPPFTMRDLVYPAKERLVIIYSTLINYLKVIEEQAHIREKVVQEKEELIHQEDNIQHDIVENVEKCRIEEAKFQSNVEKCSKLQDQYLTLETVNSQLKSEVEKITLEVEKKKSTIQNENLKETQLRERIKKVDDRIDFLEINTLPPKAEFDEKLKMVVSEVQELKSDCEQKRQLVRSLKKKLEDKESDQRNSKFALNVLLKETSDLLERNKKSMDECEELLLTLQPAVRQAQLQLMECEKELSSHQLAYQAEKQGITQRIEQYTQSITEFDIAKEELERNKLNLSQSVTQLEKELASVKQQMDAEVRAWEKVLHTEKKGWNHLQMLKSASSRKAKGQGILTTNHDSNTNVSSPEH